MMLKRIEELNNKIAEHKDERKLLIKLYEQDLLARLEMDVITILQECSFDIVEHQSGMLIHAKRGVNELRVWLPNKGRYDLGHVTLQVTYNGTQFQVAALIKHEFASVEYNYLTVDYQEQLKRKARELQNELEILKKLGLKDIDGSYLVCSYDTDKLCSGELKPLKECFKILVDKYQDEL